VAFFGGVNDRGGESFAGVLKANGDFDIPGVSAGAYTLRADAYNRKADQRQRQTLIDLYEPLRADMPVNVGDRDVEGLRITVEDGAEIGGYIMAIDEGRLEAFGLARLFSRRIRELSRVSREAGPNLLGDPRPRLLRRAGGRVQEAGDPKHPFRRCGCAARRFDHSGAGRGALEIVLAPDAGELNGAALDKDENPPGVTVVAIPDPAFRRRSDRFFIAAADRKANSR
jgi:hypothetical protein